MPTARKKYEVVSVSLPRDLVERANAVIPKARRSRVITSMLTAFLDSVPRRQLERDYEAYYNRRLERDAKEERDLLNEWKLSDQEAWEILDAEETNARRKAESCPRRKSRPYHRSRDQKNSAGDRYLQ